MSNPNLYIIGTVHVDLDGKKRLNHILDKLSPSIIALEMSKDREVADLVNKSSEEQVEEIDKIIKESGLDINQKQKATLLESGDIMNGLMGYEVKTSRDYAEKNSNLRLEYIDISIFADGKEEFTQGYVEMMKETFQQLAKEPGIAEFFLKTLDQGIDAYLESMRESIQGIYQGSDKISELFENGLDPGTIEKLENVLPPKAIKALKQICNPKRNEFMGKRIRELYDPNSRLVAIVGLGHLPGVKTKVEDLDPTIKSLAEYDSV